MNCKDSRISEALKLLKEVRAEVNGDVEDGVIQQLDEVIGKLEETCRTEPSQIANQKALKLLGEAMKLLPAVLKLIELLHNHTK